MPQVLEEIRDETAEILTLLGKLLDERQCAGGVAVDHEVAQTKQRFLLHRPEQLQQLLGCVFKALWIDALNLNDPQLTADILTSGGFDPADIERLAQDPDTKAALKATTEEAVKRGAFGAPTLFVGEQMFFGQDRMDFVREALSA